MVRMLRRSVERLIKHLESEYPKEACGILWGSRKEGAGGIIMEVAGSRPMNNTEEPRSFDRYRMDPAELLTAEEEARSAGYGLIGIYHSHPDRAAQPSAVDLEKAWPSYAYLVFSIRSGKAAEWACWTLEEGEKAFRPCVVSLEEEG